ncbi:hypothetical protein CL622_03235 [archaeon]|nr:hypothetical protein [archaeon]|tara:strand:- start:836 stop:1384 length:549 start_codon:yes stop_codon:yes gene_type:complete
MINLNQKSRDSGHLSEESLKSSLNSPDMYLAEDITDFLESKEEIIIPKDKEKHHPFYTRFIYDKASSAVAYILMGDINIELNEDSKMRGCEAFTLSDYDTMDTLQCKWFTKWHPIFKPKQSLSKAREQFDLKDIDTVQWISLQYFVEEDALIVNMIYKKNRKQPKPAEVLFLEQFSTPAFVY